MQKTSICNIKEKKITSHSIDHTKLINRPMLTFKEYVELRTANMMAATSKQKSDGQQKTVSQMSCGYCQA